MDESSANTPLTQRTSNPSNSTSEKNQPQPFSNIVDIKEIRSLVELMRKNGIAVFKLERQNFKLLLKTTEALQPQPQAPTQTFFHPAVSTPTTLSAPPQPLPEITAHPSPPPQQPATQDPSKSFKAEIKSPMVGTFYAAPAPDAPPFVTIGSTVTPDTVVCIIEAMKVMNEVKADVSGTIAEICVENGRPVQFGQVLFRVK